MKILLLTRNHVVKEFIELVADRVGAVLEVWDRVEEVIDARYDFFFVDDRGVFLEESQGLLGVLGVCQNVVLYSEPHALHTRFDLRVKKPFLPSDIQTILENAPASDEHLLEDQILNIQDIEEIKSLLEHEGMQIVSEEDLIDEIDTELGIKNRKTEQRLDTQEKLLEALVHMEPKRIRKLLRGAEMHITIKFPKEES